MNAKDDLLFLIQSLNQTEKRYFKIYAQRHVIGKSNAYIDLFEAVETAGKKDDYKERRNGANDIVSSRDASSYDEFACYPSRIDEFSERFHRRIRTCRE